MKHRVLLLVGFGMGAFWLAQACVPTWKPARHGSWALVGLHAQVACEGCHGTSLGPLPTECESCHESSRPEGHYQGPCGDCHTPEGWGIGTVDHSFFPLEHAHELPCSSCHTTGTYSGLSTECSSCHEQDRPEGHFPGADCASCHEPTTWGDGELDHSFFALEDAHAIECTSCHTDGTYTGLDPACTTCHEDERPSGHYTGVDCGACHEPTSWGDGEFDHDPIFELPHAGEVSTCTSCHLDSGNYTTFSCIDCHEHEKSETDDDHDEVSGYEYDSQACYECHP